MNAICDYRPRHPSGATGSAFGQYGQSGRVLRALHRDFSGLSSRIVKKRAFGKLNWEVSVLGFGAMRLPLNDPKDPTSIDEPQAIEMIRHGIEQGINYIDTAYPYHNGRSESVVGRALKDGYRQKVKLATKAPPWFIQTRADLDRILKEQLQRLDDEHIDFYLLHSMNKDHWPKLCRLDVLEWAQGAIADGRIGHLGFSFHDELDLFKEIVDAYDKWAPCQIQYNFMDIEFQAGTAGLQYAAAKGLPIAVMEPVRGGHLTQKPPASVAELWASAPRQRTPADWALQWVWNHSEVHVALSGMSNMQHVRENLASAEASKSGSLTAEELELIGRVREQYQRLQPIACTNCGYCMPCPNEVDIPHILKLYNDSFVYDAPHRARFSYRVTPKQRQADACMQCKECEENCPQGIPIAEWLEKAHSWLGPKKQ